MPTEEREKLKSQFKASETAIKSLLKQYKYVESVSHAANISKLIACLQTIIESDYLEDFGKYLNDP